MLYSLGHLLFRLIVRWQDAAKNLICYRECYIFIVLGENGNIGQHQVIDHYEVALGTDRRYPRTRTNVHPFVNIGLNTTWTFLNLNLIPKTSVYYTTVRAFSVSGSMAEVTSNGIQVGYGGRGIAIGKLNLPR